MSLWLLIALPTLWLAVCAMAVALCAIAAGADRAAPVELSIVHDRHTQRRPLRLRSAPHPQGPHPHIRRLHR